MLIILPIAIRGFIEKLIVAVPTPKITLVLFPIPLTLLNGYSGADIGVVPLFLTNANQVASFLSNQFWSIKPVYCKSVAILEDQGASPTKSIVLNNLFSRGKSFITLVSVVGEKGSSAGTFCAHHCV